VNAIRFKVLRKIEEGEYILDDDFLKLYILKKYFEQENIFKMKSHHKENKSHVLKEDKISNEDAPNNENNLKNTFSDFIQEVDVSKYLADAIRKKSNN